MSQTLWESRIESVKVIKFQTLKIRDVLVQLAKTSEDPKIKSETMCLANYVHHSCRALSFGIECRPLCSFF